MMIKIELHSEWRSGTGRGRGLHVDAEALRDPLGLPMLPGRQLKGLIRHALETGAAWGHWGHDVVDRLCGVSASEAQSRFNTQEGTISFSSARMECPWLEYVKALQEGSDDDRAEAQAVTAQLFFVKRQTALDDRGLAKNHSLRSVEVCAPMTLYARVYGELSAEDEAHLKRALKMIRAVGGHTTRGLGRATLTLERGA